MLQGIGVSVGIGIAQAMLWYPPINYASLPHTAAVPQREIVRFEGALENVIRKNEALSADTARRIGAAEAAIFDVHAMLLADDEITAPIRRLIMLQGFSAEYAVLTCFNSAAKKMDAIEDEYLRQRADDFYNLRDELLRELLGLSYNNASHLQQPTIIMAHSLAPGDLASIDRSRLAGIACEIGGYTGHTAIIARNLGVPAIVGVPFAKMQAAAGKLAGLDGETGQMWLNPSERELAMLRTRGDALSERRRTAQQFWGIPSITLDGHRIELSANVGQLPELEDALAADTESVGLFRTELIPGSEPGHATEEAQFATYKKAVEMLAGKGLTIRTLDIDDNHTGNPALGYRGIRMSLGRPSVFRTQLRAILRASAYGNVKILLPMVCTLRELDEAKTAIQNVKEELRRENIPFDEKIPVGLLVEVPATALLAATFAKQVDFFSIGMNDLVQFTLAADRGNPQLATLFAPAHPAVLRLVQFTINAAHTSGIPCNICGDFSQQDIMLPLFLGLGANGFSLNTRAILPARQIVNHSNFASASAAAQKALELDTAEDVIALLKNG
ncbi:phosphoenolpyruvate--protein phosphotransferase [Ruminococcaceae bacterium OttesenSCG-928-A16]|nr:phosphoenolpyruvate--protein phosphotransferase [Ruminococcaceae bacterium OttesenSCG-928-A16]